MYTSLHHRRLRHCDKFFKNLRIFIDFNRIKSLCLENFQYILIMFPSETIISEIFDLKTIF